MKRIIFEKVLLNGNWAENVLLEINDDGVIANIETGYKGSGDMIAGYALPGLNNIHSHAFQRAMAGLAEYSASDLDSFWTWRDIMYKFAGKISSHDLKILRLSFTLKCLKRGMYLYQNFIIFMMRRMV